MRVSTAFNRILALPGATVVSVAFAPEGIVVDIRARSRRHRCPCGEFSRSRYDTSLRRWRHLDMASTKVFLQAEVARIDCRGCGRVRTEEVAWARPKARQSRDYEDVVAWLAQRTDLTTVSTLMRCSWRTVHDIAARVVHEYLDTDRLDDIYRIGVDEISYRRGHQYLTVVADHDQARVLWVAKGKRGDALQGFFDALGPDRSAQIDAITMDLTTIYSSVARQTIPQATICFDPYHVIQLVNRALDSVYMSTGREHRTGIGDRSWRKTRYAVRGAVENLDAEHLEILNALRRDRHRLYRAWELKEAMRDLYRRVEPAMARAYFKAWITRALRSRIPSFVNLARSLRKKIDPIVASVELGLSNARLEGINARIRLIQRRGYGYRSVESLTSMIYLCLGGITVQLPTGT